MFLKLPAPLLSLLFAADAARALHFSVQGRRTPRDALTRRASLSGSSPLADSADLQYTTNITLNGQPFTVMIDTGSSDLWVAGTVSSSSSTGQAATISYASGGATGPVQLATLEFAGYTVQKQAFMQVPPDSEHPIGQGLIGLGPSEGSVVYESFKSDTGNTVLDNIFLQDTTTANYISFTLGRTNDPDDTFPGDLLVGEVLSNYSDVQNQPKLPVTTVSFADSQNQHFQVLLDANGIIAPDGSYVSFKTAVSGTSNKKQATVVIDSGFSLPQVPTNVAEAFYSIFSDASLEDDQDLGSVWYVPCTQEVNITFVFGGKKFPVHPLDAAADPKVFGLTPRKTASGKNACIGLFQPMSFDAGSDPTFDMVFGMAFLRNVYTLINFGDFVADGKNGKAAPYMQLLSTTTPAAAHTDFVNIRLGGVDTTVNIFSAHTPDNSSSDASSSDESKFEQEFDKHKTLYIIIAASVGGVILLSILGCLFHQRRRRAARGVYRPLNLPNPGMTQYQAPGGYPAQQTQPYGVHPPVYNPDRPYDPPAEHVPYHNPFEGGHRP